MHKHQKTRLNHAMLMVSCPQRGFLSVLGKMRKSLPGTDAHCHLRKGRFLSEHTGQLRAAETVGYRGGVGWGGEASMCLCPCPNHMTQMGACSSVEWKQWPQGFSYPGHCVLAIGLLCCHCFQMIGIFGRQ